MLVGTDMFLTPMGTKFSDKITGTNFGIQTLQEAAHRQLYIYANGSAINIKVQGVNTWKYLVAGVDAVFLLLIALITFTMVVPAFRRKEKKENL
jgi:beta-glucosidase